MNNITNGLDAALGLDWPAIPGVTGNDVSVRIVADGNNLTELTARDTFNGGGGTQWAFPIIYVNPANYFSGFKVVTSTAPVGTYRLFSDVLIEITFQGEWHDSAPVLGLSNISMQNWLQPPQTTLANGSVVWPAPILFGACADSRSAEISTGLLAPLITILL